MAYKLFCDGACRGNPGPAAIGAVLLDPNDNEIKTISHKIGLATNNESEYKSLIEGIKVCLSSLPEGSGVQIYMDSQLVFKQIQGQYKVKNERLKPLFLQARQLLNELYSWNIHHIPREKNNRADELANLAYI